MVKPKFDLKVQYTKAEAPWKARKNLTTCLLTRQKGEVRRRELDEAVKWCQENEKRGWSALKTGQFPSLRDARAINNRLDGLVVSGSEREYCSIMTSSKEQQLVTFIKNKNRLAS